MRTLVLTILLLSASLSGCVSSDAKRQAAFDSNNARMDQETARIRAEFEARRAAATTDEELDAAFEWHRDAASAAVSRYLQESSRILREVR